MYYMSNLQINVPDHLFDTKLLGYCFCHKHEISNNSLINDTIYKIVRASLIERDNKTWIGKLSLSQDERKELMSIPISTIDNAELAARIDDVLYYSAGIDSKKEISERYISLFDIRKDCDYLIRAIDVRAINSLREETFLTKVMDRLVSSSFYGNQWRLVLISLSRNYKNQLSRYYNLIEQRIKLFEDENHFNCERHLIEGYYFIGGITNNEAAYRTALSHEREGLKAWNSRKENTFYPNIVEYFRSAYSEISKVKRLYPDDEKRIKREYVEAESYIAKMIPKAGVPMTIPINDAFKKQVGKLVERMDITRFEDVIIEWTGIPYTTNESINQYKQIVSKSSYLSLFGSVVKIGRNGNVEGKCDAEKGIEVECRSYVRHRINYLVLKMLAEIENKKIEINETNLEQLIVECKPSFVAQNSLPLWYLGFLHGLKGEFIESASILVPQIESALRGWAEHFCGDLAKMEKESNQDEANLTVALKNLKDYIEEDFFNDIELFLNNSSGVNFRNKLSHGLLSAHEIIADTPFLLKIAADIYWGSKKYVKNKDRNATISEEGAV